VLACVVNVSEGRSAAVLDALAADASLTAALLAGDLPREVEETFAGQGLALLPSGTGDLTMDCTCPDATVPCKHLAAVFYLLAERFDSDPFALLALRGRDRDTVLDELRARRTRAAAAPPLPLDPTAFYAGPGLPTLPVGPRTPPDALLDQVPAFPLAVRGSDAVDLLRPLYRALGDG
jgi:uncharacterized Zn finger protein